MVRRILALCVVISAVSPGQLITLVPDVAVSDATNADVYRPHVAVQPVDGTFLVSWGDERFGSGSAGRLAGIGDIIVGRFSASGMPTLANGKVSAIQAGFFSDFSYYDSSPLLRANGDIVVAFHVDARTSIESIKFDDVYFSAFTSVPQSITLDRQLNMTGSSGSGYAYQPAVTAFGSDILFVYRYYDSGLYHTGATLVNGASYQRIGDVSVIDNATSGTRTTPAVASNGTRTMIVWTDTRLDALGDIYLQQLSGTSAAGSNTRVNSDAGSGYNRYPRVAMNAAGQAVVVWIDARDNNGGDIFAQLYNTTGGTVGGNVKLTQSASVLWEYAPGVGMDAAGNFVIAWADSVPGQTWRAKTRAFAASGVPVTPVLELTDPVTPSIQPDVAMEPGGRVTYVWLDGRLDATHGRIFAKRAQLTVTDVADARAQEPRVFGLRQNFPNPFNPSTVLRYSIDRPGVVAMDVFDLLGRHLVRLAEGWNEAGEYQTRWQPMEEPSGGYICRMILRERDGSVRTSSVRMQFIR